MPVAYTCDRCGSSFDLPERNLKFLNISDNGRVFRINNLTMMEATKKDENGIGIEWKGADLCDNCLASILVPSPIGLK